MSVVKIPIQLMDNAKDFPLPQYATQGSAGMDLLAAIEDDITVQSMSSQIIPTGIAISLPSNHEGQIRPRSGLASKHGITVLNSPGTIDSDYRGEIKVILHNLSQNSFTITPKMRIAQLVIAKYENAAWVKEELESTERNEGGFGSTGY